MKKGSSRSKCPSRKSGKIGCGEHGERQAQAWLAEKLRMRSAANVRQQRRRLDKKRALGRVPEALERSLEEEDGDAHQSSSCLNPGSMDLLTTPYTLTLPVWGWCLAVPAIGVATAYAGYYVLVALARLEWRLSR